MPLRMDRLKAKLTLIPGLISRALAQVPLVATRRCILCGHGVGRFLPFEGGTAAAPKLMVALNVVGSDVDQFSCPCCLAHDRERHLFLYLNESGLLARLPSMSVIHFAPETRLASKIRDQQPLRYIACDLAPSSAQITRADLQCMPFESQTFDLLIANHVLEHVDDASAALAEIHRVLRVGGHAILQTPFSADLEQTWEDPGIITPQARLQAYGQSDHARLFGRDIFAMIVSAGLESRVRSHDELLPRFDPAIFGVNRFEPFFLFQRCT